MIQLTIHQELENNLLLAELRNIRLVLPVQSALNYADIEDDTLFLFYENWVNKSLWEQHMESEHIKTFQMKAAAMIENFDLLLMKPEKIS